MKRRTVVVSVTCALALPPRARCKQGRKAGSSTQGCHRALAALYEAQPSARKAVESAAGYTAFGNFGMKMLLAGAGSGEDIAVENQSGAMTYMKMTGLQAGLGIGVKKYPLVPVFDNDDALYNFITSGWTFGGQATAAAKSGDTGNTYQGEMAVGPGVWLYQITDKGLALELTANGTKYYKENKLN